MVRTYTLIKLLAFVTKSDEFDKIHRYLSHPRHCFLPSNRLYLQRTHDPEGKSDPGHGLGLYQGGRGLGRVVKDLPGEGRPTRHVVNQRGAVLIQEERLRDHRGHEGPHAVTEVHRLQKRVLFLFFFIKF